MRWTVHEVVGSGERVGSSVYVISFAGLPFIHTCVHSSVHPSTPHFCRYHFMVFNASVLMWKLVRPFQIPGSRAHILSVITTASRALEEVGEEDEAWRVELLV